MALSRSPADLNPMGRSDAAYTMNGIGATFTPEMARAVQAYLAYVAEAIKSHTTGANYVNLTDLDGASPERVKAVYSADDWGRLVDLKDRRDRGISSDSTATSRRPRPGARTVRGLRTPQRNAGCAASPIGDATRTSRGRG